jgi:hypothetical protein
MADRPVAKRWTTGQTVGCRNVGCGAFPPWRSESTRTTPSARRVPLTTGQTHLTSGQTDGGRCRSNGRVRCLATMEEWVYEDDALRAVSPPKSARRQPPILAPPPPPRREVRAARAGGGGGGVRARVCMRASTRRCLGGYRNGCIFRPWGRPRPSNPTSFHPPAGRIESP